MTWLLRDPRPRNIAGGSPAYPPTTWDPRNPHAGITSAVAPWTGP